MAMEDHDLYRIKRFLPVAQNLGVAPQEMDTWWNSIRVDATRVLDWD